MRLHPLPALALAFATTGAAAMPSTVGMTCGQARSLVLRSGAAVLNTGGHTFDRYVRDRSFCQPTEVGRTSFVPTRDTPQCFIGYRCYEPSADDWFGDY